MLLWFLRLSVLLQPTVLIMYLSYTSHARNAQKVKVLDT
jgi:hypothetical protein